eukprot:5149347-Amphidinium_carterae.1
MRTQARARHRELEASSESFSVTFQVRVLKDIVLIGEHPRAYEKRALPPKSKATLDEASFN